MGPQKRRPGFFDLRRSSVVYKTPIDKRTGTKKNSSAHLNRDELPIDNFDGVGKMASSLPVALAARSGMIDHQRGQVKPLGGVGNLILPLAPSMVTTISQGLVISLSGSTHVQL